MSERVRDIVLPTVIALAAFGVALVLSSCGAPAAPTAGPQSYNVRRVPFDEDGTVCYLYFSELSCVKVTEVRR